MEVKAGQRWKYIDPQYEMIIEVNDDCDDSIVLQVLKGEFLCSHLSINYIHIQNQGYVYSYLEGQDKPNGS